MSHTSIGTIVERPDGRWMGQASVTVNGKRTRPTVYGSTPEEVRGKLLDIAAGRTVEVTKASVAEILDRWLEAREDQHKVKDSTLRVYRHHVVRHIAPLIGRHRASELTGLQIDRMMSALREKGLSDRTRSTTFVVLNAAFRWAVKKKLLIENPVEDAERVEVDDETEIHPLTPDEARRLLGAIEDPSFRLLVRTALETGMRLGELLGLQWDRVDFDQGQIKIDRSLKETRGKPTRLDDVKSKAARRTIGIDSRLVDALREQKVRVGSSPWVFPTKSGTHWLRGNLYEVWGRALKAAGLSCRFHDLRHTNATWLLDAGVDVKTVSERLGHSSIKITLETYVHRTKKSDSKAASAVAGMMG